MRELTSPAGRMRGLPSKTEGTEERLRLAEAASGIGTFEMDVGSGSWDWSEQVAVLFGLDPNLAEPTFAPWTRVIFADDVPKIQAAFSAAA
jgi:hypothetical protein